MVPDNAVVETLFKSLKSELVWRTVVQTRAEAIARYIDGFYNCVRCHSTPDYVSPGPVRKAGRIGAKTLSTKVKQLKCHDGYTLRIVKRRQPAFKIVDLTWTVERQSPGSTATGGSDHSRSDDCGPAARRKPLRCGRAIYFRRPEMTAKVEINRFARKAAGEQA